MGCTEATSVANQQPPTAVALTHLQTINLSSLQLPQQSNLPIHQPTEIQTRTLTKKNILPKLQIKSGKKMPSKGQLMQVKLSPTIPTLIQIVPNKKQSKLKVSTIKSKNEIKTGRLFKKSKSKIKSNDQNCGDSPMTRELKRLYKL